MRNFEYHCMFLLNIPASSHAGHTFHWTVLVPVVLPVIAGGKAHS